MNYNLTRILAELRETDPALYARLMIQAPADFDDDHSDDDHSDDGGDDV